MASLTRHGGTDPDPPLRLPAKLRLLWTIWTTAAGVSVALRRTTLPLLVARLAQPDNRRRRSPWLMSRAVSRGLRIGSWEPRCLIRSLVLFRLLRAQGDHATLMIGLPHASHGHEAHAWVELDGRDVGPAPGAMGHRVLARYPLDIDGHDQVG